MKKKILMLIGLAVFMQTGPTHAAAPLADLQTSLEVLKSKLVTLAQALGKINQPYIPFDELSAEQRSKFLELTNRVKPPYSEKDLAELMNSYAEELNPEGLKTFIGMSYEGENFHEWIINLYNGMLHIEKIIKTAGEKKALSSDKIFPTNDALKNLIEKIIRAIDGKPPWEIGPDLPPRNQGPGGNPNPNPNPNPSTATAYADLDADQKAAYDKLNTAWNAIETNTDFLKSISLPKNLKNLIDHYSDPNNNGFEGLRTFASDKKQVVTDKTKKELKNALASIEKKLPVSQQSSDGSSSSTSTLSEEQQAAYDELAKQRRAVGDNPQDITAKVALKALTSLMETDIADNNVALKKFIIDEYNANSTNLFDGIYQSSSNKDLKQIIKEARVAALGTAPQEKALTLSKNDQKLVADITAKFTAINLSKSDIQNTMQINAFKQEVKKLSKNTDADKLILKTFLESIQTKEALERIKNWLDDSVKQGIVDEVIAARFP